MPLTKKYNFIIKSLILSITFVSLILLAGYAKAYERPEFKDGLTDRWHPGGFCIPCHYTLLSSEKAQEISKGCKNTCHALRPEKGRNKYEVDMNEVSKIHDNKICIRCHVGKDKNSMTASDFHKIMSKTACLDCHKLENGIYIKPKTTECSECHGGGPHVVHGKKIENMCEACHGEYGDKYLSNLELQDSLKNISNISRNLTINKQESSEKEFPTLGQFVAKLIGSLVKING